MWGTEEWGQQELKRKEMPMTPLIHIKEEKNANRNHVSYSFIYLSVDSVIVLSTKYFIFLSEENGRRILVEKLYDCLSYDTGGDNDSSDSNAGKDNFNRDDGVSDDHDDSNCLRLIGISLFSSCLFAVIRNICHTIRVTLHCHCFDLYLYHDRMVRERMMAKRLIRRREEGETK